MTSPLEYHISVRHSIPASLAFFSLLALPVILVSTSRAQINGAPASVTSPGFGGRAINGTPPSVTSLGPHGFAPNSRTTFSTANGFRIGDGHHHHRRHVEFTPPPLVYAVPVPYAVDLNAPYDVDDDASADDRDPDYQGGPTIFDRRSSGAASYIPPVRNAPVSRAVAQDNDTYAPDPDPPQEPTLLIFKDGRKLELENYAIIGVTLFDLTPGHSRRVALADLDLEATRKQNDDRGVVFQVPSRPTAN